MNITDDEILDRARAIMRQRQLRKGKRITSPSETRDALKLVLGSRYQEVFAVMFLDTRNRLIKYVEMFYGTIDGATVHPREIVRQAIAHNAAAVILVHNHPSGVSEPSLADISITGSIRDALALVDVRTLDHLIVGDTVISLAEMGKM